MTEGPWLRCFQRQSFYDLGSTVYDCEPGALYVSVLGRVEEVSATAQRVRVPMLEVSLERLEELAGELLDRAAHRGWEPFPTDIGQTQVDGPRGPIFVADPEFVGVHLVNGTSHGLALLCPSCVTMPRTETRYNLIGSDDWLTI